LSTEPVETELVETAVDKRLLLLAVFDKSFRLPRQDKLR
jgi:hypothetical protein